MSDRKRWQIPVLLVVAVTAAVAGAILFAALSRDVGKPADTLMLSAMPDPDASLSVLSGQQDAVVWPGVSEESTTIAGHEQSVDIDAVPADGTDDQSEEINPARRELEYLKEALPGNLVVPAEKTAAEVDDLFAEFDEYQALVTRMEEGSASAEDRSRYYEIRMTKFQEEIALINMCNDLAANQESAPLCANMAASSAERLADIEKSMQALEQGW